MPLIYQELTETILSACFEVIDELGAGFLESVYQKALLIASYQKGFKASTEIPIVVLFRGQTVGQFYADILVEDKVIIELIAITTLASEHKAQVINYLKATGFEVGLLVNFGNPKLEYYRVQK